MNLFFLSLPYLIEKKIKENGEHLYVLICYFCNANWNRSGCQYRWQNLDRDQYGLQPIKFVNSVAPCNNRLKCLQAESKYIRKQTCNMLESTMNTRFDYCTSRLKKEKFTETTTATSRMTSINNWVYILPTSLAILFSHLLVTHWQNYRKTKSGT